MTSPKFADGIQVAKRAFDYRKAAGLTLQAAADRIGITKSHLWEFEKGSSANPTLRMITGLAQCYGVSPTEFMSWTKPTVSAEGMAAWVAVDDAIKAAYRRGYADGQAGK